MLFFRDWAKPKTRTIDNVAVESAVIFASWNAPALEGSLRVMGPAPLDTWADALENLSGTHDYWSGYGGNGYVAQCVLESRSMASQFLRRLSVKYLGRESKLLFEAADIYEKEKKLMEEFTRIFPYSYPPSTGGIDPEHIKNGAEILRKMRPLKEEAIEQMNKALEKWETA